MGYILEMGLGNRMLLEKIIYITNQNLNVMNPPTQYSSRCQYASFTLVCNPPITQRRKKKDLYFSINFYEDGGYVYYTLYNF